MDRLKEVGKKALIWLVIIAVLSIIIGSLVAMAQWHYLGVPDNAPTKVTDPMLQTWRETIAADEGWRADLLEERGVTELTEEEYMAAAIEVLPTYPGGMKTPSFFDLRVLTWDGPICMA